MPYLSLAIWVPIAAAVAVLVAAAAADGDSNARAQRWIALWGAILGFVVTIPLYTGFDPQNPGFQFVEKALWIERFDVF